MRPPQPTPRTSVVLAVALASLTLMASPASAQTSGSIDRRQLVMGTVLEVRIDADSRQAALDASERVLAAVVAAESRLSTWRDDSELARLMAAEPVQDVAISSALADDLDAAQRCYELTTGAFDPSVGPLVAAWGLRDGGRRPDAPELQAALDDVGLDSLQWTHSSARRLHAGTRFDEGGFGKGAGLDDALSILAADERVERALLDFGGQLLIYRREPGGHQVEVQIADPDDRGSVVARFSLGAGSVATSGNGERGIVVDGVHLGHVLDPRTGLPAADFGSVTVWTDESLDASATLADCLSTGLYVLGPGAALDFAANHPGIEVLVAERTPAGIKVRASDGIAETLSPSTSLSAQRIHQP